MLQKKICMLGSFSVGKTSLVKRFVESIFSERYLTTVGVKIDKKVVTAGGGELMLMLWDLYGEDEYQKIRMSYLRGASGYLLVADGTRPATLDKALAIQEEAEKNFGPTPYVVALNKFDLTAEWEIPTEREAEVGGRARGAVVRTSAKTGEGVELAFDLLAKTMIAT
jgi:small GTP-binding protein